METEMTKGRFVRIVLSNGEIKEVTIKNLLAASNPPHPFCGFITTDNKTISLLGIDHVEL